MLSLLPFIDVAAASINVRMERMWDEHLNNITSEKFKNLQQEVITEIERFLPDENGNKPIVRVLGFR
jgi:hypothetical protein